MQPGELQRDGQRHRRRLVNFAETAPLLCAAALRRGFSRKTAADTERGKKRMRPCTGALIGGIIYSRTKEESCPAKPAARSFPYSTRRQQPAREHHTDAKEQPFFCVGFFLRSCLWCAKGNGCSLPLRLAKVQKRWSFSLYGCLFHRPCLRCTKGNGYSLPLRLAKVQKRWSFSLCGCFFFGLAFGAPKAMGILSPSGSLKSKSMGLFHCAGAFSPLLPSVRQRQWAFSPPPARSNQKAWVFFTVRVLFPRLFANKKPPFPTGKGGFQPEK